MIRLEGIRYRIGEKSILENIDLDIPDGKVTVIFGPSGAGKSTLLRVMNLLTCPDAGNIHYCDEASKEERRITLPGATGEDKAFLRRHIGMVFQHYTLFSNKTVLENITEGLRIVHKVAPEEARKRAMNALQNMHMEDRYDAYPHQLSGGQRQRVSIARILALRCQLTLMDEPTSALDHDLVEEVQHNVEELVNHEKTVVIVSHDINFARSVADRVYFIEQGRITAGGTAEEIFDFAQL